MMAPYPPYPGAMDPKDYMLSITRGWDWSGHIKPQAPKPIPFAPRLPKTMEPRAYQIEGAQRLLDAKRFILGDDAGLGKTLEAAMAARLPALIVCPTYLVWQWAEFLEEQYPDDTIAI